MKALTLTQPWATLVALGVKRVETRSWSTGYRGPLLIHAAKGWSLDDRWFAADLHRRGVLPVRPDSLPLGAMIARTSIDDVLPTADVRLSPLEIELGDYAAGRYAWFLGPVATLPLPIPMRGALVGYVELAL